jgi:hypothetical protein
MTKKKRFIGLTLALMLAAVACNLGASAEPVSEPPLEAVTEVVGDLVESWKQAFEEAEQTGVLTISITEQQMSTFVAVAAAQNPAFLLANPQVDMRDGEMEVSGSYSSGPVNAQAEIIMEVSVNAEGIPVIEVTSARVGPLPVPPELLTTVSDAINDAVTGELVSTATGFTLVSIVITEGLLTISGTLD